jgi:hypothetical protein
MHQESGLIVKDIKSASSISKIHLPSSKNICTLKCRYIYGYIAETKKRTRPLKSEVSDSNCKISNWVSHHHQPRRPPLHPICAPHTQRVPFPCLLKSIPLTVHPAIHLKIIIPEHPSTITARQTTRMIFLLSFSLEVLAFNAFIARLA